MLTTFSNAVNTTNILGYQAYGPYGNKLASSGTMGTAKGFTGQYQDPSGLDYYNARYYDPVIGCFISADTVQGNAQGMDPYAYVNGNPETLTDPTGQVTHCHEPGDCGPGSYTTDVSGGATGPVQSVCIYSCYVGSGGSNDSGGCAGSCDGAYHRPPKLNGVSGNPKAVLTTKTTTTSCSTSCVDTDKVLIDDYYKKQIAHDQSVGAAIGDAISVGGDILALWADWGNDWDDFFFTAATSLIPHLLTLVADTMKALGGIVPQWLNTIVGYVKVGVSILNGVRGFLRFLDIKDGIIGKVKGRLLHETKNGLAEVIGLLLSNIGSPATSGISAQAITDYYNGVESQINSSPNDSIHDTCVAIYKGTDVNC